MPTFAVIRGLNSALGPQRKLLLAALFGFCACGSNSSKSDAAGGTAGDASAVHGGLGAAGGELNAMLAYSPCSSEERVGGFALKLVAKTSTAELSGAINDKVDPRDVWSTKASEGDCELRVGPRSSCSPACSLGSVCDGSACVSAPAAQSAGTLSLSGLAKPVSADILASKQYYAPRSGAFPPFEVEAPLVLSATGGDYSAFSLAGRGIAPLEASADSFAIEADTPLSVAWTAPTEPGSSRISISLDLAHHGSVAARLECEVPDTGSATLSAALLAKLVAEGVAGFPSITITRRTMDSVAISPGCVDFAVASSLNLPVSFPGLLSCDCPNDSCAPCSATQRCQADYTCK